MKLLLADRIIDPAIGFHYAYIRSLTLTTELHRHDFYECFLTFGGPVYHLVNENKLLLTEGSLVWIRPDDAHCYELMNNDCQIMNVAFPRSLFESLAQYAEPHPSIARIREATMPPVAIIHELDRNNVKLRFERLAMSPAAHAGSTMLELKGLLLELLSKFDLRPSLDEQPWPGWLTALLEHMRQKEHFSAGLDRLYELSGKNKEYVSRVFQKRFGQTPTQWLNQVKLAYAARLLQYTDEDIAGIALDCGFDNLSHFYHLFKEQFRTSPAKYRKTMKKPVIPG